MAEETIVRSRTKGFRDLYVAKITRNDARGYQAGTPVKLARAITGKISDKYTSETIYSDDGVEETVTNYEGTDVEFEVNSLAPQDKSNIYGHLYENGFLVKTKDDRAPEVAIGYRAKKMNGKYEFVWLYCGRFAQGSEVNYETEGATAKTQTASLKGTFYGRALDGAHTIEVDEGNLLEAHTTAMAAIANWFSAVQEKNATLPADAESAQNT